MCFHKNHGGKGMENHASCTIRLWITFQHYEIAIIKYSHRMLFLAQNKEKVSNKVVM